MEAIPHCIGHLFTSAKYDKLKAGPDNVCLPQDLDMEVHSVESLRSLLIAHLFVFQKLLWDVKFVSHGNHVGDVLGTSPVRFGGMPRIVDVSTLSTQILHFLPQLSGMRVLCLVHNSVLDRNLPVVCCFLLCV